MRERERERVCVCVFEGEKDCESERNKERGRERGERAEKNLHFLSKYRFRENNKNFISLGVIVGCHVFSQIFGYFGPNIPGLSWAIAPSAD